MLKEEINCLIDLIIEFTQLFPMDRIIHDVTPYQEDSLGITDTVSLLNILFPSHLIFKNN